MFILTLPIPIVVNSFAAYYKNRLWRNEVAHKRSERMKTQMRMITSANLEEDHTKPIKTATATDSLLQD